MTLDDLIRQLEENREVFGGDAEVRLMTQPNWPFEHTIAGVVSSSDINTRDDLDDDSDVESDSIVYILEGTQLGYGSKRAWDL